jgi:branched-chain amino acid aminotransferase
MDQQELKVYIDGQFRPEREARISVYDHGLLYGDGVFEGIRAYDGRVFMLDRHLDRLYDSARSILLEVPLSWHEMKQVILETLRLNGLTDAYIRPIVTRGPGDFGIDPRRCVGKPTVIVIAKPWLGLYTEDQVNRGLRVMVSSTRAKAPDSLSPSIKCLNYLTNILAKIEANVWGADEAILLDAQGNLAECSTENIFLVKEGGLVTPPTMTNLPGVTRFAVLELARKSGIEVIERYSSVAELYAADECFITGTAVEVVAVTQVEGRTIGTGRPGEMTIRLREEFRRFTRSPESGTPYRA